ncbi:hypothetical protein [Paractinoplanes hotanensis]|uniref:Galactose mutarotase n=1 Tax=Paractinoplanes hotanensis TaxID=2906497 RepID=A0ABT0XUV4_9ACTN|nr:hypothetical protein [Actinoplanes hotanensis]MCM4077563.1 hypothetical protein [Actinoplanes hotanensis]
MVTITTDPALGGRWTSLRTAGHAGTAQPGSSPRTCSTARRDWLWHRPDPARASVRPGDAFVDAGGLEECIPTIRGAPDHGDAWSRPWTVVSPTTSFVRCPDFTLRREITSSQASYRLEAAAGWRFLWAAHALLDVSPDAVLLAPDGTETRVDGRPAAAWPVGLEQLGPDDGTAIGAILVDCPATTVADGERLTFTLEAPGQPISTALWRNLRGWPTEPHHPNVRGAGAGNSLAVTPYRSIGVEPMLGRVFDLAEAGPGDAAVVPPSGVCEWTLTVTAG